MHPFGSLVGSWRLRRVLSHGDGRPLGDMTGTVTVREVGPRLLHYREDGELTLHGPDGTARHRGTAWREYHYELREDGLLVRLVPAGTVLHALRFADPPAAARSGDAGDLHLCGADRYLGRYRFTLPESFEVEMTVRGPAKDYRTHTRYRRLAPAVTGR